MSRIKSKITQLKKNQKNLTHMGKDNTDPNAKITLMLKLSKTFKIAIMTVFQE